MKSLINQPDAPRLIYGLRDTGYNFQTAAADIIDNSVAAGATEIHVQIQMSPDGRKTVYFGDNGSGMDEDSLFDAMRYGAPARENPESLGKFGLGLKTASSSVCLRFALITRCSKDVPLQKLVWDLEHVEARNQWEMIREDVTPDEQVAFDEYCGDKGTLLVWSKCDRLLSKNYEDAGGSKEQNAIRHQAKKLAEHVALIYHRFLDRNEERERLVSIFINGESVDPWNPFYPTRADQVLAIEQQKLEIEMGDDTVETATMSAWILPNSRDLTKEEQKEARISNRAQGFYILREGRVIQAGGWLGMFGLEPHTSLLRIEFDFNHKLDEAFSIDVKKSRILFDPALEEELKKRIQPVYREADNRYRRKTQDVLVEKGIDHGSANKAIGNAGATTQKPEIQSVDAARGTVTLKNNRGPSITIRSPVEAEVDPDSIHVEAVESITSGHLWEPVTRESEKSGLINGVRISKHHDFYQKIYQRAAASGYTVEGMDLLLWAFAIAEQNNTNPELEPIFEDIRDEVSRNLKRLLRDVPLPDDAEMRDDSGANPDVA